MVSKQCSELYHRKIGMASVVTVRCTYLEGHPGNDHSWRTLKLQDVTDAEEAATSRLSVGHDDATPADVQVLLDVITAGNVDPYLEAILAVAHNRKRTLRGVRGFGRL